jgi:hypothetical protein
MRVFTDSIPSADPDVTDITRVVITATRANARTASLTYRDVLCALRCPHVDLDTVGSKLAWLGTTRSPARLGSAMIPTGSDTPVASRTHHTRLPRPVKSMDPDGWDAKCIDQPRPATRTS